MKTIITRDKRNVLDTTINWMMGIKTEVRKPTPEEIEIKKSKKSPYNLFDYTIATVSSAAVVVTNVIHPDVALANATHFLSKRHLEKKLDRFNNPDPIVENTEQPAAADEEPVEEAVEGEVIPAPAV